MACLMTPRSKKLMMQFGAGSMKTLCTKLSASCICMPAVFYCEYCMGGSQNWAASNDETQQAIAGEASDLVKAADVWRGAAALILPAECKLSLLPDRAKPCGLLCLCCWSASTLSSSTDSRLKPEAAASTQNCCRQANHNTTCPDKTIVVESLLQGMHAL